MRLLVRSRAPAAGPSGKNVGEALLEDVAWLELGAQNTLGDAKDALRIDDISG